MTTSSIAPIVPARTALMLMDFQPVTMGSLADTATLIDRGTTALAWARSHGVQVVYIRVAFRQEDYAAVPTHNKAFIAVAEAGYLADDAPETQIHEAFEVLEADIVARKIRFGAFSTTDVYADLHAQGIDALVLAGISTGGVVLSTVRDAADADYRILVLSDAVADPDPDVHRILLERVFPHQADIITVDDLAGLTAQG